MFLKTTAKLRGYYQYEVKKINLSGTNARIDLSKSVESRCTAEVKPNYWLADFIMTDCDLSGVDLSDNTFNLSYYDLFEIVNCNLDDTKINFYYTPTEGYESDTKYLKLENSSFRNADFTDFNFRKYCEESHEWEITNCDFSFPLLVNFLL